MSKIVQTCPDKWYKFVQTNSNIINLVETSLSYSSLIRIDHSQLVKTCLNFSQLISFQFILYNTISSEISILRAFWGPLPKFICWTNYYIQNIVIFNILQGAVLITITEFSFLCLYRSMPTMDDDFWTIYLVGITSLISILVASSFKCLSPRPILQEVSELIYI